MKLRWFFLLMLVVLSIGGISQAQDRVLVNPIAYTGYDGNIYITDLINTYAITDDAFRNDDEAQSTLYYARPRWSANGQALAFFRITSSLTMGTVTEGLMVVRSGEAPRMVLSEDDGYSFDSAMLALSPDGSQVAFFGWSHEQTVQQGLFTVAVDSGEVTFVVTAHSGSIGEPGAYDPAIHMALTPTGNSSYRDQFALSWGQNGLLFTPAYEYGTSSDLSNLALITPDGEPLWTAGETAHYFLSEDGMHVAGRGFLQDETWVTIDADTGEHTPLILPEDAQPVGWIGDQLFYRTRTDVISITGNLEMPVGMEVYDYIWGFEATSATLTIYAYMPDGEDVPVATLQGYDIGLIHGADISHMVVNMVRSSVPAVLAINEGAAADAVEHLLARPESIALRLAYKEIGVRVIARTTLPGFDAIYGSSAFTVMTDD